MTWNNRVFRHTYEIKPGDKHEYYSMHEAYYEEDGKVISWTANPVEPYGRTVDELIEDIEQMLNDAKKSKNDILDYDELQEKLNKGES